jgi:hypothetical protein
VQEESHIEMCQKTAGVRNLILSLFLVFHSRVSSTNSTSFCTEQKPFKVVKKKKNFDIIGLFFNRYDI